MKVIKKREDFEEVASDWAGGKIGYVNIRPKPSGNELHAGHEYLINYVKANHEFVMVSFHNMMEGVDLFYNLPELKNTIHAPWDVQGCLKWCEQRGVDYVVVPDPYAWAGCDRFGKEPGYDIQEALEWVDRVWAENGYPDHGESEPFQRLWTLTAKYSLIRLKYTARPGGATFTTWKNGEIAFIAKDWCEKFFPEYKVVVIDPLEEEPGILHSSSHRPFAPAQKTAIKQMGKVIEATGHKNAKALAKALNALDKVGKYSVGLKVREIGVLDGRLAGNGGSFVNVIYEMNGLLGYYPYYKKDKTDAKP